ncbi:MAG: hypothetical protein JWM47_3102 [Acidimicrobiales bacterium]|nr:hypothetical protein [Acidimicrobiales bacterium]
MVTVPGWRTEADRLLRARYVLLALVAVACAVLAGGRGDWDLFAVTGRLMLGDDGLHVFARHHDVQTGPVTLVVARVLAVTPRDGFLLATLIAGALGIAAVRNLEILAADAHRGLDLQLLRLTTLLGGLLLVFSWAKLGGYGHLDDAIVLWGATVALRCTRQHRPNAAALVLGALVAVKPWAGVLVPIALDTSVTGARRWHGVLLAAGLGAALWAPFLLADSQTLESLRPNVLVAGDSVPRLFGAQRYDFSQTLRTVQLLLALGTALLLAWRGRVASIVLAAVAVRLALDPGTWSYYTPGLLLGALAFDLLVLDRALPLATTLASIALVPSWMLPYDHLRAALRLAGCAVAVITAAAIPQREAPADRDQTARAASA